ncbi:MAG: ABC transporter ATP-binding protein [Planctomycetota bacterium]
MANGKHTTEHRAPEPILELEDLKTYFTTDEGVARAVDGVSVSILPGETLGVVGESGCGKSVTALSILQLVPSPPGKIVGGEIRYRGRNLVGISNRELEELRGNEIAMIFQEPMTALNPVYTVGEQIAETVRLHRGASRAEARAVAVQMLRKVKIPSPETRVDEYPHQLSGGMRQRVMIALAMCCDPKVLIADEPTTALDVTVQAQILELIAELQASSGMAVLLITHDLGVIAETADHVAVMYAGKVVEFADVHGLFENPKHPYTVGLFKSLPDLAAPGERLYTIPGMVPSAYRFPEGCRFAPRCPLATDVCRREEPPLLSIAENSAHTVACHHSDQVSL